MLDLRMPNGQLVEFYAPLKELDSREVKGPNHLLFEKWRNRDMRTLTEAEQAEYEHDRTESQERYGNAYLNAIHRMGLADENAARASWIKVEALLSSMTG